MEGRLAKGNANAVTKYFAKFQQLPHGNGKSIGTQMVEFALTEASRRFKMDVHSLRGFVDSWNARSGGPFTGKELNDIIERLHKGE